VNEITFLLLRGSLEVKKAWVCCVGRHVEVELQAGKDQGVGSIKKVSLELWD
jgi:hypothetical protein